MEHETNQYDIHKRELSPVLSCLVLPLVLSLTAAAIVMLVFVMLVCDGGDDGCTARIWVEVVVVCHPPPSVAAASAASLLVMKLHKY